VARGWRAEAKRYGAPAAFLAAITIAVLLVRSGLNTKSAPAPSTVATTTATTSTTTPTGPRRKQFYRLKSGETLSDVAIRYNTTVAALLALNPGIKVNALIVGQRIRVR
jgi:peptidoglycan DL-endopeptidase LytF